jgi:hypothetical protein
MIDAKEIRELLLRRVADLAEYLFPKGHREGNHWRVGSITGEPGESFDICVGGPRAGYWGDWAASQNHSRNLLDLWKEARGVDFRTALHEAADWLGISLGKKKSEKRTFDTLENAIAHWALKLRMQPTRRDSYEDKDGNDHFVVARFDGEQGKTYRPFHREKSGGWVTGDPPGRLPLFRLPKLLAPDLNPSSERIFIVEGEKCVCDLETCGFLVTTSAHGAKGARKTDWEPLAGRFAVILPDNDKTGEQDYSKVVTSILFGLSQRPTIKIVHLPDLPPKGDIVDWLEKRDARETEEIRAELLALVKAAEVVTNVEQTREILTTPVTLEDFCAYMPMHAYIFVPARDLWPASSVDARLPVVKTPNGKIKASRWLDQNRPVEMMTWAPAKPMIIANRLISEGGWIKRHGCSTFNLYRAPTIKLGDATKAGPWLDHVAMLYPHDKDHLVRWFASRVQRPHVKINHAIYMGGPQGIGKDTLLYPVKHAVGTWNVTEILPPALLGRFNGFVKSVLLCINEVHDLGDLDRYALYERLKAYTAAPPDTIRVDEKNIREYQVLNVCGVIITSNYKTGGLYLPADDRRHYVAWSDFEKESVPAQYWRDIYAWYALGGIRHVAAYLAELDISDFNPKAPPPKTDAFWEIVESNRAPENSELADALEYLGNPDVVTVAEVIETRWVDVITSDFADYLQDRKQARHIPHRFEEVGYVAVRNPDHKGEGRWRIGKRRCVIYAKKTLSKRDQLAKARAKIEAERPDE